MKNWYVPSRVPTNRIGTRNAIKHKITRELALVGKHGSVWEHSSTHCRAVITSFKVARKHLPKDKWPVDKTDETLVTFGIEELEKWVKILKIPVQRRIMLRWL